MPTKRTKRKRKSQQSNSYPPQISNNDNEMYCICQTRYDEVSAMIQCPNCLEWFHNLCIGLKETSIVFDDAFDCPLCKQRIKNENIIDDANNVKELHCILETIPLHCLKEFMFDQIKNDGFNASISRNIKCKSMNDILPDDIIQKIISFDGDRNKHRIVAKNWNKLCDMENTIQLRRKCKKIKQQNDKKEKYLTTSIREVNRKRYGLLRKLDGEYESDKKRISDKYKKMCKDLEILSRYRCACGNGGIDNVVKCTTCKKYACSECILDCDCGDGNECGSAECFCSKNCDKRKECGCSRLLCDWCHEQIIECGYCSTKICESCVVTYTKYEEGIDMGHTTYSLCQSCYDDR